MNTICENLVFNFDAAETERPITEHWQKLEAYSKKEFSEESLCVCWLSGGKPDWDWWKSLPNYKREHYMLSYRVEREMFCPMRKAYAIFASVADQCRENERLAQSWANQIKEAAVENKPCPMTMSDEMTGAEKLHFKRILARAYQIAGVVIVKEVSK